MFLAYGNCINVTALSRNTLGFSRPLLQIFLVYQGNIPLLFLLFVPFLIFVTLPAKREFIQHAGCKIIHPVIGPGQFWPRPNGLARSNPTSQKKKKTSWADIGPLFSGSELGPVIWASPAQPSPHVLIIFN